MNKLTKLLSVFIIAGAVGTGIAGVAGCNNKKPSGSKHTHDYTWVEDNSEQCHEHCDVDGCDTPDKPAQDHVWGNDAVCDNCGYEMKVASVVISGETTVRNKESITLTAAVTPDAVEQGVTWSIAEGGDYATINASTGVLTGTGIGTVTVKATSTKDTTKFGTYKVKVIVEAHTHQWSEELSYNTTKHFKVCGFEGCEEHEGEVAHVGLAEDGTGTCTICGAEIKHATYELVPTTILQREPEFKNTTYADGLKSGIFTILPGTTVRTRDRLNYKVYDYNNGEGAAEEGGVVENGTFSARASIQYNGQARGFSVNAVAPGKLTFYCDNGSGGKTKKDKQTILLTKPDGSTEVISYFCGSIYAITINCDEIGEYKITRGNESGVGTTDVYYVKYEANVLVTPIKDIEIVDKGKTVFTVGDTFDKSKLQLQLVHEDGLIDPVDLDDENLVVDTSAFNGAEAGTYTISISYSAEGKQFTTNYSVTVFDVTALELGFNSVIQGGNTSYGNGQYINHTVKQFYFKGDELDLDGLTVKTILGVGEDAVKNTVKTGYTVSGFDTTTAGKKTITVTWDNNPEITATFDIYVFDGTKADVEVSQSIAIKVDGTIADAEVGTVSENAYQFKTIQQSLDFLEALKLDENVKKVITLAEGTYKEKLEINIPNLTIKGGTSSEDAKKYVIEWDSLYGLADEGGFTHTTDSTQTVSVREKATGLVIDGVTISNWYNSDEHFTEANAPSGEHRALAILIQADKVVLDHCRLLGYQDTIELFTGRQVIQNTYICGRTDFIFGTNNTTYFYKCEIESIVSGGYVTAFKGNNKGDEDYVQYGAIFDDCDFTAPQAVTNAADTSLGRTWGKYAAVAVVNSRLGGHITKNAYGSKDPDTGKALASRYTAMSGAEPTDATVKFFEGNNTGAGATDTEILGMHLIAAADLANYSNKEVLFAKVNGLVTYSTEWDGSKGVEITEKTYAFNKDTTGLIEAHATTEEGDQLFNGQMTVIATGTWTNGSGETKDTKYWTELTGANGSKDFLWVNAGAVVKMNLVGSVTVSTYGSNYGSPENLDINYINGKAIISIKATAEKPINNGCCITVIKLDTTVTPDHSHKYGEWTVEKDEGAETYTATRTCVACELETADSQVVALPALSEDDYEIAASTTAGKFVYTYTHETYGKITFEADALAGMHQHSYGDWVYDAENSKITSTCNAEVGECEVPTIEVEVPELTDSRYVITDNNADLENGGTGTYTIELDGETYEFTAPTPKREFTVITEDTTFNFRSTQTYKETTNAGQVRNYGQLIIKGNENGQFKSNNGDWYVLAGDATLELKIKDGTKVTVQIGYCQDCLNFNYNGTDLTISESGTFTKTAYAGNVQTYTFIASEDGELKISKLSTASGTTYIGNIKVIMPISELETITEAKTFNNCGSVASTSEIEFSDVSSYKVDQYWIFDSVNGYIKFKVADGAKITITSSYWGGDILVNNEPTTTTKVENVGTVVVENQSGEITITPASSGSTYITEIKIEFPDAE